MGTRVVNCSWAMPTRELLAGNIEFYDCDPHFHNTYTLGLVKKGTTHLTRGEKIFLVEPGDVFLIHPYEVHGGGNTAEAIECDILYPSIKLMAEVTGSTTVNGTYPYFGSPVFKRCKATERLFNATEALINSNAPSLSEQSICDALNNLFGQHVKGMSRLKIFGQAHPSVYRAFEEMLEHFDSMKGSSELSEKLGVSRYHFIRVFQKALGMPPSTFLRQLKVAKAWELIFRGDTLVNIAMDVGFFDQGHMTREFKNVYGFPPGIFSRNLRMPRPSVFAQ